MDKPLQTLQNDLEKTVQRADAEGMEFWFARDLLPLLGYARWENFLTAIQRAAESCKVSGHAVSDHFRGVTKMVRLGSGAHRERDDFMLTRYACYLLAQNGDPRKPEIAFAQSYFAVQTRRQELIEDRMRLQARLLARDRLRKSEKALSKNIYERGVDGAGFGRIRSSGDQALFGGSTTQDMKDKYGIVKTRPLADFLPALTIAAKKELGRDYPDPNAISNGGRLAFPNRPSSRRSLICLGSLDDLIAAESRKLEALREHKKGLLQNLFPSLEG